jgi:hypothetical protein
VSQQRRRQRGQKQRGYRNEFLPGGHEY